jgi:hypothetical protein
MVSRINVSNYLARPYKSWLFFDKLLLQMIYHGLYSAFIPHVIVYLDRT